MSSATITSSTFTLVKQGTTTPVAAAVTYTTYYKVATLDPTSDLEAGATYTATVKGGTGGVADGTALATTRMYDTWDELVAGYTKSLHTTPVAATLLPVLLYVVPVLRGDLAAVLAGVAGRALTSARTGSPVWPDALLHPLSVALLGWLSVRSRLAARRGTLTWKGRSLP